MASGSLLHVVDYVIFAGVLAVSLAIGIFYSIAGDRQRTTNEYLLGNRNMALLPVTLSLTVSFVSSNTFLGYPAESYSFGSQMWMSIFGAIIGMTAACYVYVNVFYDLKLTSVTEYLELRYESRVIRYLGSVANIFSSLWYVGSVYFGPSTAIEAVTGFPAWGAILISSMVSIIYTTIGGIKAVVWTDAFQSLIMICGLLVVVIKGLIITGGFQEVFSIAGEWGRLNFFTLDPDPTRRLSLWGVIIGDAIAYTGVYGYVQVAVQRYSSLPSLSKARASVMLSIPGLITLLSLAALTGLIVFAYYTKLGCDPLANKSLNNPNQIVPYFIAEALNVPGLPGLFLASVTAASLSTVSSSLNSNAAILWKDFFSPRFPNIKERNAAIFTKGIVFAVGIVATLMAMAIANIGGTIIQMSMTLSGSTIAPVAALYLMGIFIPWVNWKGALVGSLSGFALGSWVAIGSFTVKKNWTPLPSLTINCTSPIEDMFNQTTLLTTMHTSTMAYNTTDPSYISDPSMSWVDKYIYSLSFIWLKPIFMSIVIIITVIVSAITGFRDPKTVEKRLVHPLIRRFVGLKVDEERQMKIRRPSLNHDAIRMPHPHTAEERETFMPDQNT